MSRYETLNVSLQTDNNNNNSNTNRNQSRLSQTVDYNNNNNNDPDDQIDNNNNNNGVLDGNQSDQRVKRFRELYFKNQKLRRELKILNSRLNQKLEKVKFPNVKKRAASVDLNRELPSKALQRQLENAYKQVKMYKQQIQTLRIKQQTPENYAKLRDMQNSVAYKDKQILQVQQQLKSVKNIKKMQQKKIVSQLQNEQVKQRIQQYQKQHKQLRQRLKQISRKSRKRQQQYKKQQAYLVSLGKKYRIAINDDKNDQQQQIVNVGAGSNGKNQPVREISEKQFHDVKMQITNQKKYNDQVLKKTQILKKQIKAIKDQINENQQKLKQKDALSKTLGTKIIALNRLIREQQKKPKQPPKNPLITNIQDIQLKNNNNNSFSDVDEQQQQQKQITVSKQDLSIKKMLKQMQSGQRQKQNQREWKGKYRKMEHGFSGPNDKKFQFSGKLIGFQVSLDQNQAICGIAFIFDDKNGPRQQPLQGKRSNIELKWQLKSGDKITKLSGSFTEQNYLNQLIVVTKNNNSGVFGSATAQPFTFRIADDEGISGCFGAVKELGNDRKITQLGFWIEKLK